MYHSDLESLETEDFEKTVEYEEIDKPFEPSFKYHAVPLDEQMALDERGTPYTLKELIDLKELREELD